MLACVFPHIYIVNKCLNCASIEKEVFPVYNNYSMLQNELLQFLIFPRGLLKYPKI